MIDSRLRFRERFPCRLEPCFRYRVFYWGHHDPDVGRAADAAELGERVVFAVAELAVEDDDGLCAVIAGVDRFGDELRVLRQAVIAALRREASGLVSEN